MKRIIQRIGKYLLFKVMGFTVNETVKRPNKYVIALAPHTSNWDFVIGQLYSMAEGVQCDFMMKKEWFFWPLGPIFRKLGGVPVQRSKQTSLTDQLAQAATERNEFRLCITPEGTRKLQPEWKKGFYYIALKAGIPILLYGLDYKRKLIQCTKMIMPSGNIDTEMREIKEYFEQFQGKKPELFSTGL